MKVTLNGQDLTLNGQTSIHSLLEKEGYADKLVAVAVNGTFVPKSEHNQHTVNENDTIEIVAPMQGG